MSVAKRLVSKNKKRYKEDGFDLDLSYITPNMIAMGFPAEKIEGVFRNHIDDVYKFFKLKHDGHFLIYNLCSERQSNEGKLENRVVRFPFDDHNPPPFPLIYNFCIHAKSYLDEDEKNIIGVHCKAGKGRTGVMICCLLMFLDVKLDPDTAMNYYAKMRTYDEKGVTIPSQQRYIHYFYLYLKNFKTQTECNIKEYTPQKLHIDTLLFDGIGGKNDMLEIKIKAYSEHTCIYKTSWLTPNTLRNSTISQARIAPFVISGDIMFEVFVKNKHHRIMGSMIGKFWLNTYFMTKEYDAQLNQRELPNENTCISANNLNDLFNLTEDDYLWIMLHKQDIDKLNKDLLDKEVPKNFKIIFGISKHPLYCHKIVSDISIPLSKHSKKQKKKQRSLFSNIVSLFDKSHATERRLAHSTIFKRNNRLPSKDISKSTKNLDKIDVSFRLQQNMLRKSKSIKKLCQSALDLPKLSEPVTSTSGKLSKIEDVNDILQINRETSPEKLSVDINKLTWHMMPLDQTLSIYSHNFCIKSPKAYIEYAQATEDQYILDKSESQRKLIEKTTNSGMSVKLKGSKTVKTKIYESAITCNTSSSSK